MTHRPSLRFLGLTAITLMFVAGGLAGGLWVSSTARWQAHLDRAYAQGVLLYSGIQDGAPAPQGITLAPLPPADAALANRGQFAQISGAPRPAYVTNASILTEPGGVMTGQTLTVAIVSDTLSYPLSDLPAPPGQTAAARLGQLTRLMAEYCSQATLFIGDDTNLWHRVEGEGTWGCAAAPRDLRLLAILLSVFAIATAATVVIETSAQFTRFAQTLRDRRRFGGPESYDTRGPVELHDIVGAVNSYLEAERAQLSRRAEVLSAVSHDLGTPATRLRLRSALIEETELRDKLQSDIDSMTGIIESVLTYTRSELNAEQPRPISLTSLVQAVVEDYQDMQEPVSLTTSEPVVLTGGQSVFMSARHQSPVPLGQPVLISARPIALKRALSNLIDNALAYGRRASLSISATASQAVITVEDAGGDVEPADIEALLAPFRRGDNVGASKGFGLGLTIAANVAEQHGGTLRFEAGRNGLRACLELQRS